MIERKKHMSSQISPFCLLAVAAVGCATSTQPDTHIRSTKAALMTLHKCVAGSAITLTPAPGVVPHMAVDDRAVYWTHVDGFSSQVMRIKKRRGDASALVDSITGATFVATADSNVYYVHAGATLSDTVISTVPNTGGTPVDLVSYPNYSFGMAANDDSVAYFDGQWFATDVKVFDLASSGITTVASGVDSPRDLQVDDDFAYWHTSTAVMRVLLAGSKPADTIATRDQIW